MHGLSAVNTSGYFIHTCWYSVESNDRTPMVSHGTVFSPYQTDHAYVNWDNVCGYDFTLEQINETCSKKKQQKNKTKKGRLGVFVFACCQSSHSPGAKVTLPSSACFENTTGPKGAIRHECLLMT